MSNVLKTTVMLGFAAALAIFFASNAAAEAPNLKIAGKVIDMESMQSISDQRFGLSDHPEISYYGRGGGRTFFISIKNIGTQDVFFTKMEILFSVEQSSMSRMLEPMSSNKGYLYTNTLFDGVTIKPNEFYNNTFDLTAVQLNSFISTSPMYASWQERDQLRLRLNLFNEAEMFGSGWKASIPLTKAEIGAMEDVRLPESYAFSFEPFG